MQESVSSLEESKGVLPYTDEMLNSFLNSTTIAIKPSRKWCIEIASKAPYTSLAELFDRAEKIAEYCKQEF